MRQEGDLLRVHLPWGKLVNTIKVTVDLQGTIFCDFSLSRQSKHYQFNYIFQKNLFKNLEMHASYSRKRVFK